MGNSLVWRIKTNEINRSSTVRPTTKNTGAMVVRAAKGPVKPVLIDKGDTKKLVDIFGEPTVVYRDIWEAMEYVKKASLYVSAPYTSASDTYNQVKVTDGGSDALDLDTDTALTDSSMGSYTFADKHEYFTLLSVAPSALEDVAVKISFSNKADNGTPYDKFTIEIYQLLQNKWTLVDAPVVSLDKNAVDGYNQSIYIETVLEDNIFIQPIVNLEADLTAVVDNSGEEPITTGGFVDDMGMAILKGGTREVDITLTELTVGWDYFKSANTYPAKIFMDPSADPGMPALFSDLRNTYQIYGRFILPLPKGQDVADVTGPTGTKNQSSYAINNRGCAFYWNWGKVFYGTAKFWVPLVGRVGGKYAAMVNVFNGLAPAGIDENGHGGQLGGGILEMEFDPSPNQLELMDSEGINAIVPDPSLGPIIESQRTSVSASVLSDDSWIGHSGLFDYVIENIANQVLRFQAVKLNDDIHRRSAAGKGNTIMAPLKSAHLLNDYIIQCDLDNNDANARAARKFVFTLAVQVTPFSEFIEFNFIKTAQGLSVESVLSN